MITFPPEFVTTRYPGYFWNTKTQSLFSIKVTGELREIKFRKMSQWNRYDGYQVSHKGQRRFLPIQYLKTLSSQEIPVCTR